MTLAFALSGACAAPADGSSDAGPAVSLAGPITCPDETVCADGLYCVITVGGIDSGMPRPYTCHAPPSGCTPEPVSEPDCPQADHAVGCLGLPSNTCPAQLCEPDASIVLMSGGRVIECGIP